MRAAANGPGKRQNKAAPVALATVRIPLDNNLFTLDKSPLPKLQDEQGEDFFGVILTHRIGFQQLLDCGFAEESSIDCPAVHEHVPDNFLEVCPQPRLVGQGKS